MIPLTTPLGRLLVFFGLLAALAPRGAVAAEATRTVLGIRGERFELNGHPTFLLGCSYYAGLGATEEFLRQDLVDLQRHGFNWLRVWATWDAFGANISAVDSEGRAREPFFGRLRELVKEADRRGVVIDLTLARHRRDAGGAPGVSGLLPDFESHLGAVETICTGLRPYRNWFLDLANERDIRDARFVPPAELKRLRERVRELDPARLVTASFGGHDLGSDDVREALVEIGVDFLSRHRPRTSRSPAETEAQTRICLGHVRSLGRTAPLLDQEPFRRGYGSWQPTAADFQTDLAGALAGGAAGWCFHNGAQRGAPGEEPRRSFDLRTRRLWVQLDPEERSFVAMAKEIVAPGR